MQDSLARTWNGAYTADSYLGRFTGAVQVIARNRLALCGVVIVGIWLLTALFAPYLATHDPYEINIGNRLKNPSLEHWLGTDSLGRDTYSRMVFGARTAFKVAIGAVFIGAFLGIPIGAIAGFGGRWMDAALMRLMDAIIAFHGGRAFLAVYCPGRQFDSLLCAHRARRGAGAKRKGIRPGGAYDRRV
jgi:ABC-type dipeptide/oligopeptide/nickel transport system permease subunit